MTDTLHVDDPAPGVRRLTVDRPAAMNAFDVATFAALDAELGRAADDPAIRAIVLAAAGGRAFSAGFDIHEMAAFDPAQMRAAFVTRDPVFKRVALHRCAIIAAVDGICYGAGALLALAADIRLATPAFRFKVTATAYGSANATWSLPPLVGPARAKEILMSGRVVAADEAAAIGLVNRVVPAEALADEAVALAATIAGHPPPGVEGIKQLVDGSLPLPPGEGWQAEHDWMLAAMEQAPGGSAVFAPFLASHNRKS